MKISTPSNPKHSTFGDAYLPIYTIMALFTLVLIGIAIGEPLLIPPLAATAAYIFGAPSIPGTQPRSVIIGHTLAALIGFALVLTLGTAPWVAALAAGIIIIVMNATKFFHIPAVATASLVVLVHPPRQLEFLALLVLSTTALSLLGFLLSRTAKTFSYPAA